MTTRETGVPLLEKKILAASFVFIALPLALIAVSVYKLGQRVPTCAPLAPFTKAEVIQHAPDRYEVHMLARMWEFEPKVVKVPKGATVDFYIVSEDVSHGFYVSGTNVNLTALPNVVNYGQARFDRAGSFRVMCNEYCGLNHARMNAVIEVTESGETPKSAQ